MYIFELYWALTYFISIVSGCVSISAFASLVRIPVGNTISAIELKICVINEEIKRCKKKNKKVRKRKISMIK